VEVPGLSGSTISFLPGAIKPFPATKLKKDFSQEKYVFNKYNIIFARA
jgi:hypothetical protein